MKKNYMTPTMEFFNVEIQEVIAQSVVRMSDPESSGNTGNYTQGTGSETMSSSYRNTLWD